VVSGVLSKEWQDEAKRRFPRLAEAISAADSPYLVWIDLSMEFGRAYETGDLALVADIYAYAGWCCRQPPGTTAEDDLGTCVATCFFEHIPTIPPALEDMPRWWTIDDVVSMKQIFSYMVGEEGYAKILGRFRKEDIGSIQRIEWRR
jgi:hypothetical protein